MSNDQPTSEPHPNLPDDGQGSGATSAADEDAPWDLAQRLALVAMALTPLILGAAVFLLLKRTAG